MTTPIAEKIYLAQHLSETDGQPNAVFNPNNLPVDELPVIMGFNNGGSSQWYSAVAIAQDGTCLGGHVCSHEGYMPYDLGITAGTRQDRHEGQYQKHYPDGYRMEFIPSHKRKTCELLKAALELNKVQAEKNKESNPAPLNTKE